MTNRYWTNNDPGSDTGFPVSWFPGKPVREEVGSPIIRTACIRLGWGVDENGNRLSSPVGPALYYPTNHGCCGVTKVYSDATTDSTGKVVGRALVVETDWGMNGWQEVAGSQVLAPDSTLTVKGIKATAASGGGFTSSFVLRSDQNLGSYPAGTSLPAESSIFNPGIDNLWLTMISYAVKRIE